MRLWHSACLAEAWCIADPEFIWNYMPSFFGSVHESTSYAFLGSWPDVLARRKLPLVTHGTKKMTEKYEYFEYQISQKLIVRSWWKFTNIISISHTKLSINLELIHLVVLEKLRFEKKVKFLTRLNFKVHVQYAAAKAASVANALARLMPNTDGPRQPRRKLLASVVTSILTYGIATGLSTRRHHSTRRGVEYLRMRNMYSSGAGASLTGETNWKTHWDQYLSQKPSWNWCCQRRKSDLRSAVSPQPLWRDFEKRSRSAERRGYQQQWFPVRNNEKTENVEDLNSWDRPREVMLCGGSTWATKGQWWWR